MEIKKYIEGNWHQLKGKLVEEFGKLTDNDWVEAEGNFEKLVGKIQKTYSITKEEAQEMLNKFESEDYKKASRKI